MTAAFAQAGGGDIPTGAKKQGEKEQSGSSGMSKSEAGASSSATDNKPTTTGGQPGGTSGKN